MFRVRHRSSPRRCGRTPIRYGSRRRHWAIVAKPSTARRLELQKKHRGGWRRAVEQVAAWRYDWAYLNWRLTQLLPEGEKKRRRELLREAEAQLDLLIELDPQSAEAHALRGTVVGNRIEGGLSAAWLGRRSERAHERALELGPDNPRVALQHGIGLFHTPRRFGGGGESAAAELRRSLELFEDDEAGWPDWGRVDALVWLAISLADLGLADEARRSMTEALALEPDNLWIQRQSERLDRGLEARSP